MRVRVPYARARRARARARAGARARACVRARCVRACVRVRAQKSYKMNQTIAMAACHFLRYAIDFRVFYEFSTVMSTHFRMSEILRAASYFHFGIPRRLHGVIDMA